MSTSDGSGGLPAHPAGQPTDLAGEIARLANELFAALPGLGDRLGTAEQPSYVGGQPAVPPQLPPSAGAPPQNGGAPAGVWGVTLPLGAMASPGAVAPPRLAPSALGVGAGGVSPSLALPPAPGFAQQPPVASAPPPKESDLRAVPAMLADALALPSPIGGAADPLQPIAGELPYFLALAGHPAARPPDSRGAPAAASAPQPRESRPLGGATDLRPEQAPVFDPYRTTRGGPSQGTGLFDAATVKRDFPILRQRVHGRPLVWLDNAATTQKPQAVIDRLSYYYEHENSNIHRAAHALAARATDAYEAARDKVRRFLGAPSARDIIFVRGATEGINLIAQSWGRRHVGPGDEIVISWLEHHANIVPWQQLASEKGARLRVIPVDDRGQVILEEYEKLLGPRTRLVSVSQVSNALGTIVPVKEMVQMAHRYGARIMIDGAQAVSHMRVDVQALDCDFYCFSGHKVFAPTGIGAVYGKSEVLEQMPPWQGGGNMIADVTFEKTVYQAAPFRFEAGTGNIADAVGLGAALDYLTALGLENVSRHEHELLVYATEQLACVPGLRMIGTAPDKAGVLSFVLDGLRTEDVGGALDQEGIAVRSGHHCAQPILRRFGLESTVRASLAPYNTRDDIDALIAALQRLQAGRPQRAL